MYSCVFVSALAQIYWCRVSACGLTFLLTQLANQKLKRQSESESADTCTPKRTYFYENAQHGYGLLTDLNNVELAIMNKIELISMGKVELASINNVATILFSHDDNVVTTLFSHHCCNTLLTSRNRQVKVAQMTIKCFQSHFNFVFEQIIFSSTSRKSEHNRVIVILSIDGFHVTSNHRPKLSL